MNPPTADAVRPSLPVMLAAVLLLLLHLALGLGQMNATSMTFDEGFYIARGWAWWRTGAWLTLGHPPLASTLAGLPLLLEPELPEPAQIDGWDAGLADTFSNTLLWNAAPDPLRIIWLSRMPFLLLSLLLGAFTFMWARQRFGDWAGLLALGLHALSPNLLGNAPLAATDLPVAAFFVATLWAYWRALEQPRWPHWLLAGVLLGLTQASKFSGVLLGPLLALLTLVYWRRWWVGMPVVGVALLTLWGSYGFAVQPWPLAQYVDEIVHFLDLAGEGHYAYLFGELSLRGWWYYHPVVLAVKTPLVVLALLAASLAWAARARNWQRADSLLLGAAGAYLALTMLASLNVGYRYLLPMLPLLHVFAAGALRWVTTTRARASLLAGTALLSALALVPVAPDYLSYFNRLAGGPENGWRVVVDSNLDWGQGLPAVAEAFGDAPVYLSYFGQSDPAAYGVNADLIPGWPPPSPEPRFSPAFPAPGTYVISASNLVGVQLYEPNAMAWFRDRPPDRVLRHQFFVYAVPERPAGQWFHQCIDPVALLEPPEIRDLTGRYGLSRAAFDCESALLLGDGPGWLMVPNALSTVMPLPAPEYTFTRPDGSVYFEVHYLDGDWSTGIAPREAALFGDGLRLDGASVSVADGAVEVQGQWTVVAPLAPPVSIFAHLIGPDGEFVAAGDALGAPAEQWAAGQTLVQAHRIPLPAGASGGPYRAFLGVYRLDDGTRYVTDTGVDGVQVGEFGLGD